MLKIKNAILFQCRKEGYGETWGDQGGIIFGHREGCNSACHFCKSTGSKTLDREEGEDSQDRTGERRRRRDLVMDYCHPEKDPSTGKYFLPVIKLPVS